MKQRKPWFCQECRIIMKYNEKQDFYECPECGMQVWPPDTCVPSQKDEIGELMSDMTATHRQKEILIGGAIVPGGNKKSKTRKTERMKKETLATLNRKLYGEV